MDISSVIRRNSTRASAMVLLVSVATSVRTMADMHPADQTETPSSYAATVPAALVSLGVGSSYYSPHAFVVDKKARTITVWIQDAGGYRQVAQHPADLGKNDGDKKARGDHRTPEGAYFLLEQLDGPSLDFSQYGKRAFTTNYPNFFDRRDGKTGSGIWLHAVPDHTPLTRGSRGCVVVRNDVILDLTQYVRLNRTPILIEKEIEMVPAEELKKEADLLIRTLDAWRAAWAAKDIESYISHYGADFKAMNMNREQWKRYKSSLNEKYQQLNIKITRPLILRYKDRFVARFLQEYQSDQHADFGEKVLYLRKTADGLKIVGEDWREDGSQIARDELKSPLTPSTSVTACVGQDCARRASTASAN